MAKSATIDDFKAKIEELKSKGNEYRLAREKLFKIRAETETLIQQTTDIMNTATTGTVADATKAKEKLATKHEEEKKKLQEFKDAKRAELKYKQEFHNAAAYALLMVQTKKGLAEAGRKLLKADLPENQLSLLNELIEYSPDKDEEEEVAAALDFSEVKWSDIELGPVVGEGAFGKVYKGTCKWIEVAVKELKNLTDDAKKKFQAEARLLSNLKHESIIQFVGMCMDKDETGVERFVLLTEYAPNGSLADYIGKKKFPPSEKVRILREVAAGMNFLHNFANNEKGVTEILHLDLKPANILLDDCWRARIADFGMSRVIAPVDRPSEFLSFVQKTVGGTPLYMAPELLSGSPPTKACDVYSFGIMCWEVLQDAEQDPNDPTKILAAKPLYPEEVLVSLNALKEHVVTNKHRPKEPSSKELLTNHEPYQMCSKCWAHEPEKRGSFADLNVSLSDKPWCQVLAFYLEVPDKTTLDRMADAMRREGKNGGAIDRISWASFKTEFSKLQSTLNEEDRPDTKACAALLGVDLTSDKEDKYVEFRKWEYLHMWFGPFTGNMGTCLSLMYQIVSEPWFFGELSEQQANELLAFQQAGTYLVRYSVAKKGIFTVSYVSYPIKEDIKEYGENALVVYHERFYDVRAAGLVARVVEFTTKNPNKKLKKMTVCPGRPDIFARIKKS